jgi:hypothetical protein
MFEKTYLQRAGQLWKVWTTIAIAVLGAVTVWLGQSRLPSDTSKDSSGLILLLSGIGVTFGALAWAVWSVRCPTCRAKLFWRALSEQGAGAWLHWLLAHAQCPFCGATGLGARGNSPQSGNEE